MIDHVYLKIKIMNKVSNVISIWDNGEVWPCGAPIALEVSGRGAKRISTQTWVYRDQRHCLSMHDRGYRSFYVLPDHTGFVAIDGSPGKHAHILNGDGSIRFILTPSFNVRRLSLEQLAKIKKLQREGLLFKDGEDSTLFHYVSNNTEKLEIFGDDGFGDCYYTYDWNTGALISARALPYRT
ncbi:hypothetical protein [Imbroritus primus]|uniref:hypothetical protein n=1 Tax=Imbroritus primus TaxID=3058603 RepID=UPI003D1613F7